MLIDGLNLAEGSVLTNATIASGTEFPQASIGELFFRSDLAMLHVFNGTEWLGIGSSAAMLEDHPGSYYLDLGNATGVLSVDNGGTGVSTLALLKDELGLQNLQPLDGDLTAIAGIQTNSGLLRKTAANTWVLDTSAYLTGNQTITVTGDVAGSGATAISTTLASVGTPGTYKSVTTDAKGRVTAGTNPTTLAGYGITDALKKTDDTFTGNLTMVGDIVPSTNVTYNLGSPTKMWKDIYVGPGSIYMNGVKILEQVASTVIFSSDLNQNVRIETSGTGNLELQADTGGSIQMKGTLSISSGKRIVDSAGIQVEFADDIAMSGNKITGLSAPVVGTDAANKAYVDSATLSDATLVRTTGAQTISGDKTFTGNTTIAGNLTISGTTTTVNSQTILLADNILELNSDFTAGTPSENAGIQIRRGDLGIAQFLWDEANDRFTMVTGAGASLPLYTGASITAGSFVGPLTGNATTATTLATPRTINGASFNGSANISFTTDAVAEGSSNLYFTNARASAAAPVQSFNGRTGPIALSTADVTGALGFTPANKAGDTFTGPVTAPTFVGALMGNAATATSATTAASATKLATARTINGSSFDGTANISFNSDSVAEGSSNLYFSNVRAANAAPVQSVNGRTGAVTLNTDSVAEGASNLYMTNTRVLGVGLTGLNLSSATPITTGDNILTAAGKLQAQFGGKLSLTGGALSGAISAPVYYGPTFAYDSETFPLDGATAYHYGMHWETTNASATYGPEALLGGYGGISLVTGGLRRVRVTPEGNVGIGTSNPLFKLSLTDSAINTTGVPGKVTGISIWSDGTASGSVYGLSTSQNGGLEISANQANQGIRFYAGTSNSAPTLRFTIGADGNVTVANGTMAAANFTMGGNQVLGANNYNNYSPTLTGGNASGTWPISITGNAAYATNATRLYASDSSYVYGGAAPYYLAMTYDGTRWRLNANPGTPAAVGVAYADVAGNASNAGGLPVTAAGTPNTVVARDGAGNIVASGVGGFTSATYVVNARNPIWRFGNSDAYGISYFQGTSGWGGAAVDDTIGLHFGTATSAGSPFLFHYTGRARFASGLDLMNSGNLNLYANGAEDIGDIVWMSSAGAEKHRLYDGSPFAGTLGYRANGGVTYGMIHSGNIGTYIPATSAGAVASTTPVRDSAAGLNAATYNSYVGDSGYVVYSLNTTAGSTPPQFYIKHNLGNVEMGNFRGSLTLFGNASTATLANNIVGFVNSNSNNAQVADSIASNGISYVGGISLLGQTDGALYSQAHSAPWQHQIYGDYRTGQIVVRGKNSGTWQAWRTVMDETNLQAYMSNRSALSATNATYADEARNNYFYVRGTSPTIQMVDTDQGQSRYVHHNSGYIGFLNSAGNWVLRCDDGTIYGTFNGSGSGLTGTAGSLTAGALSNHVDMDRTSADANSMMTNGTYGFAGTIPNGPGPSYLAMMVARNSDVGLQIAGGYNSDNLYFRGWYSYGGGFTPWRTLIHNANIGSQAVASAAMLTGPARTNGTDGWFRSTGATGWYNESYGVGIFCDTGGAVKTYNSARIISNNGSQSLPAFSFSQDQDTGLFSPADGYLGFCVNAQYAGYMAGTSLNMYGDVTAFSDERLKKNWVELDDDFVERWAKVKHGIYDRIDYEMTQVGLSAQSVQEILPNAVQTDKDGMLSLNYGGAAAVASVQLAKKVVDLEAKVARLEALVSKLIGE